MLFYICSKTKQILKGSKFLKNVLIASGVALGVGAPTYSIVKPAEATASEPCTPHYLKGLTVPKNNLEALIEKERVYSSNLTKYPEEPRHRITNGSEEREVEIYGVKVKLIFPGYAITGDKLKHYNAAGIDTYPSQEFECMVQDNVEYIKKGATLAMADYEKTLDVILKAQETELKKTKRMSKDDHLKDLLDKEVPGYKGLKLREVLFTPETNIQDFLPRTYYFGEIPALGVTYINTGIIGMDPKARMLDHINGWPATMVHEMTHSNPKLQSVPMLNYFDPELWASFPMLSHSDMTRLMGHQYMKDVRKLSKILFNFDSALAYQDMISTVLMTGVKFESENKYQKVREYHEKVEKISAAIRDVAFNEYIPEFYTHPLYYMAVNDFMNDKNAAFKIIIYKHFEPSLLGGPEKTREFIEFNMESAKNASKKSMIKMNDNKGKPMTPELATKIKDELQNNFSRMNPSEKEMLLNIARQFGMPENGNIKDLIEFGLRLHNLGIADINLEQKEELLIR